MPSPGALDDGVQRLELRSPTKLGLDFFRRGDESWRVPRSTRFFDGVDLSTSDFTACIDHLADARTPTRTKIVKSAFRRLQSENVRPRKIDNMDVIADASAIQS